METKNKARLAGVYYLILIICGVYAELIVRVPVLVPGNAVATAERIMASAFSFRIAFVADLIAQGSFFMLAWMLYTMFRRTHHTGALLFLLLTTISVCILSMNMLNHVMAYEAALAHNSSDALLYMTQHKYGYLLAQPFYGGWLLPLGYLMYRSAWFPRWLGVLVMLACLSHWVDFLGHALFAEAYASWSPYVTIPSVIGEFSLCLWLLIKGVKKT